jgi:HSP20 family protein
MEEIMNIVRWDSLRDPITLRESMNRLFKEAFGPITEKSEMKGDSWNPSVDIYETDDVLFLTAEIPGLDEKDIEIQIEDNTLSLKGERQFAKETKEENYRRIERSYGSFCRSFSLPRHIDQENIKANHENGVLKITMPKKKELKPKTIKIVKAGEKKTK